MRRPGHDISPRIRRAAFQGMLLAAKRKNLTLSEWFAELFTDKPIEALSLLGKFLPAESRISATINRPVFSEPISETDRWVQRIVADDLVKITPTTDPDIDPKLN